MALDLDLKSALSYYMHSFNCYLRGHLDILLRFPLFLCGWALHSGETGATSYFSGQSV